jgi:hypothetical protein
VSLRMNFEGDALRAGDEVRDSVPAVPSPPDAALPPASFRRFAAASSALASRSSRLAENKKS